MAAPAGLNRGPVAQFGSNIVNVPHQTTAAIAKELLDTGRCIYMGFCFQSFEGISKRKIWQFGYNIKYLYL